MGTDIHMYVERLVGGKWERATPAPWTCPWCGGSGKGPRNESCWYCDGEGKTDAEYGERNYDLFAMLAGVRNGVGFAGCDLSDGFVPLSEPRGIPEDTSIVEVDSEGDDSVWLGDHSYSYATLAEVLAYDYERTTNLRGVVSRAEYIKWVESGRTGGPESYCGDVSGRDVRHVSVRDMDRLVADPPADGLTYYTRIQWTKTYRECAGKSWFAFLDALKPLGDPNDIRLVFGFDS